jgi:hypothetical protein
MKDKKIKVIFLDIDGVMNSRVFFEKRYNDMKQKSKRFFNVIRSKIKFALNGFKYKSLAENKTPDDSRYTYEYQFKRLKQETCPEKWKWLSEFCNENNLKICVSSVWKNHFGDKEKTIPMWWDKAFTDLGFNEGTFVGITGKRRSIRGEEIKEWLDSTDDVENFSIIDDDSDMLEEQFNNFHHSDPWFGLNPNHLYRIKRQLDGKSNYINSTKTLR